MYGQEGGFSCSSLVWRGAMANPRKILFSTPDKHPMTRGWRRPWDLIPADDDTLTADVGILYGGSHIWSSYGCSRDSDWSAGWFLYRPHMTYWMGPHCPVVPVRSKLVWMGGLCLESIQFASLGVIWWILPKPQCPGYRMAEFLSQANEAPWNIELSKYRVPSDDTHTKRGWSLRRLVGNGKHPRSQALIFTIFIMSTNFSTESTLPQPSPDSNFMSVTGMGSEDAARSLGFNQPILNLLVIWSWRRSVIVVLYNT